MKHKVILICYIQLLCTSTITAQMLKLNLFDCVYMALNNSLQKKQAQELYYNNYWEFRSYKASLLPRMNFNISPVQYNRNLIKRYDYNENLEIYRYQQSFLISGGVSVTQNIGFTGGTLSLETELGYMRNFGANVYTQISSIPFRIGYSQTLVGFNPFKWKRKIEPLKFKEAKMRLIYQLEEIAEYATKLFFDLAITQKEYEMAQNYMMTSDTLYKVGLEKERISTISQAEVLTLELNAINAQNQLKNAKLDFEEAQSSLLVFLNIEDCIQITCNTSEVVKKMNIPLDQAFELARRKSPELLAEQQNQLLAEQQLEKSKKESCYNVSLSASMGFNQAANTLPEVYRRPLQQNIISIGITVPIVDWGIKKNLVNIAKNNLKIAKVSAEQKRERLQQDIIATVNQLINQQEILESTEKALRIALLAYDHTKKRFIVGREDVNNVLLALNRYKETHRNNLYSRKKYWLNYFKIRKLTLYDFAKKEDLIDSMDQAIFSIKNKYSIND